MLHSKVNIDKLPNPDSIKRSHNTIPCYSKKEILKHNKPQDCWIIVKNKVYDITPFLQKHPGGKRVLLTRAGEDATSYFMTKHGLDSSVEKMLARYLIGELLENEKIDPEAFEEAFIQDLLKELQNKNLFEVDAKTQKKFTIIRTFALLAFFLLSTFSIYQVVPLWLSFIFVSFQAIIGISLFGLIAHESTHRNFPKSKIADIGLSIIWPIIWPFISRDPLTFEHNSHHVKIGDEFYDFEVAGLAKQIKYYSKPSKSILHKNQHKLAFIWYPFYAVLLTIGGATASFWSSHNRNVFFIHGLSLITTALYYLIIPSFIIGFQWQFLGLYLLYQTILYSGIYLGAAINHFVPESLKLIPRDMANKYGYYIAHHTTNFGIDNSFWFWFTGGFNIQIEHHLVPFVPVENLRKMMPIVQSLCKKYNYPYHNFKNLKTLWNAHYDYLAILSKNEIIQNERINKTTYQAR